LINRIYQNKGVVHIMVMFAGANVAGLNAAMELSARRVNANKFLK
jgi:hypothetical protein